MSFVCVLSTSLRPRGFAIAGLALGLSLLQGCGGGGSASDPTPVKVVSYDLQATMTQYYTKAQSWTLSGNVGATPVTAVLSLTPKTGTAVFAVNGKAYPYTLQEMKLSANGASQTSSAQLFFDPALVQTEANSAVADGACEMAQTKGSFSRNAKVGDSGSNGNGVEYVSCAPAAAVEANYVDTWQLKEEGSRVLLCLNRSSKVVATGFNRVGSQCLQVMPDGSFGTYMSLNMVSEEGTIALKTQ